jgi:hypothetical protein
VLNDQTADALSIDRHDAISSLSMTILPASGHEPADKFVARKDGVRIARQVEAKPPSPDNQNCRLRASQSSPCNTKLGGEADGRFDTGVRAHTDGDHLCTPCFFS